MRAFKGGEGKYRSHGPKPTSSYLVAQLFLTFSPVSFSRFSGCRRARAARSARLYLRYGENVSNDFLFRSKYESSCNLSSVFIIIIVIIVSCSDMPAPVTLLRVLLLAGCLATPPFRVNAHTDARHRRRMTGRGERKESDNRTRRTSSIPSIIVIIRSIGGAQLSVNFPMNGENVDPYIVHFFFSPF